MDRLLTLITLSDPVLTLLQGNWQINVFPSLNYSIRLYFLLHCWLFLQLTMQIVMFLLLNIVFNVFSLKKTAKKQQCNIVIHNERSFNSKILLLVVRCGLGDWHIVLLLQCAFSRVILQQLNYLFDSSTFNLAAICWHSFTKSSLFTKVT